jgi:AbiV family abortive infection protein
MQNDAKRQILKNADRLLSDAEMLLAAGRHPTATSLAVLAIEELGKIAKGMSTHHGDKESAAIKDVMGDALHASLSRLGFQPDGSIVLQAPAPGMTDQELRHYISQQIGEDFMNSPVREMVEHALTKRNQKLKQNGFYLDLEKDGSVKHAPWDISQPESEKVVATARLLVDRMASLIIAPNR